MLSITLLLLTVLAFALLSNAAAHHEKGPCMTVIVGPDRGDILGKDSFALQKAADELARRAPHGGGTLEIRAGTYTMYDSLHIRVPMTVHGAGPRTILLKAPQVRTPLIEDYDLSEYTAVVDDVSALRTGMGVTFKDSKQHSDWNPTVRSIVGIDGRTIRLDRRPERDYATRDEAWLQNSFPLVSVVGVDGVTLEGLVADGNLAHNRDIPLDGCRGGAIYLHHAKRCIVRRCIARNYNLDGISWQTTEDILVEDCSAFGNAGFGLHPGTGSLRTTIRNCRSTRNGDCGLFVCWGVRNGRFVNNIFEDNARYGISIGHKDTDNLFLSNQVRRNGKVGILFRDEPAATAAHRCLFRDNQIEANGEAGIVIDGETRDTRLEGNTLRNQPVAIQAGPNATNVIIEPGNKIEGEIRGIR